MNETIKTMIKEKLKEKIQLCTEGEQMMFKRMYANGKLDLSIEEVIDNMDESKMDWAMSQIERTIMKKINTTVLTKEKFLIVDNAIDYEHYNKELLNNIFRINNLSLDNFNYEYVKATGDLAFIKISQGKNILVSTSFTTIKSNAVEDLIIAAVENNLKDKNVFSIMPFSVVGRDFENYKTEIKKLSENNIKFYFISENYLSFDVYETVK